MSEAFPYIHRDVRATSEGRLLGVCQKNCGYPVYTNERRTWVIYGNPVSGFVYYYSHVKCPGTQKE